LSPPAYYELEKVIEDDPVFKTKKAQRKVARFAHMHPTAISQKVEVIVEHFRRHVMAEMAGQAKAMVVTSSREAALKYYFGMQDYIAKQGYAGIKALVAFSGELEVDGQTWTEAAVNGFSETGIAAPFRRRRIPSPDRGREVSDRL
jgi:type I restriction enzyme, R subunit